MILMGNVFKLSSVLTVLLSAVLMLTNPPEEHHLQNLEQLIDNRGGCLDIRIGGEYHTVAKEEIMKHGIKVKNVLFYSVSSFSYRGENIPAGFGFLSYVYRIDYKLRDHNR